MGPLFCKFFSNFIKHQLIQAEATKKSVLVLILSVFALASTSLVAQTSAGRFFIGAQTGLNFNSLKTSTKHNDANFTGESVNRFEVNLDAGYFVIDDLAISGMVGISSVGADGEIPLPL